MRTVGPDTGQPTWWPKRNEIILENRLCYGLSEKQNFEINNNTQRQNKR